MLFGSGNRKIRFKKRTITIPNMTTVDDVIGAIEKEFSEDEIGLRNMLVPSSLTEEDWFEILEKVGYKQIEPAYFSIPIEEVRADAQASKLGEWGEEIAKRDGYDRRSIGLFFYGYTDKQMRRVKEYFEVLRKVFSEVFDRNGEFSVYFGTFTNTPIIVKLNSV